MWTSSMTHFHRLTKISTMDGLDDFLLFNAIEDSREESERDNNSDNYNSFDSSWDNGSSDDNDDK